MSVKDIFDIVYALLVALVIIAYCAVKIYGTKHEIKNKWVAQIPDLAAAFVHEAEATGDSGEKKMDLVINSICAILRQHGITITPEIESLIKAFAEKEVAKMKEIK